MDLKDLLSQLDSDESPTAEYLFYGKFRALGTQLEAGGQDIPSELVSEEIAFMLHSHDSQDPSSWGLYFGPFFSAHTPSGEQVDSPPLSAMTADVLEHWRRRAKESSNPVMRARYADLLWEMPKKLQGAKPDPAMARTAIDSYLEAIEGNRYEHSVHAVDKAKRALEIALTLKDKERIERVRDVMLSLEDKVAEDESLGLWGFCFDLFVDPPNKRIPLSSEQREKIVSDMEARLQRTVSLEPGVYHPWGAEEAAIRLANYYRRSGSKADMTRVLTVYGEAVRRIGGIAPPLIVSHSLERLYSQFKTFEMHNEANALNELMRVAGEATLAEMKPVSGSVEIPREKAEAYFAAMLKGDAPTVLSRVAVHFAPKRNEIDAQLRSMAEDSPLLSMLSRTIKDHEGRTVAEVGPLTSDVDGQVVTQISNNLSLASVWLREMMARAFAGGQLSPEVILNFLLACPLFEANRHRFLDAGLKAYSEGDALAAIHILVPQVEYAVRQLAIIVNAPIYAQRRGGGFNYKTLDELLRDASILAALGETVVLYLRVLFTDARGWNVRNEVSHGLASAEMMSLSVADRVVHALLLLALVRDDPDCGNADARSWR
jgi:hypothetical protein